MAFPYRAYLPPYAIAPEYDIHRPACLYVPSPIVDYRGFMRECIKHRGAMIIDLSEATGPGLTWEQKWINYVNVVNSVKPWRAAGKPFVCDRFWLWTS
ncbi:Hypothetical predicted protein [Podarcis lilfordi]|uniref:Uncharacterized protein n=1 Tax=Podarcis lilfordi TaxID=74358 RepID=A0AA35LBF1_9SAUR|nr:Hypothetical predicted protein [Podarcis lilfordi]